jgi:lysophospholipase L1-like esterase
LNRTFHPAWLGVVLVASALSANCGSTPTAPTPTPVDPPVISCPASQTLTSPQATPIPVVYGDPTVVGGKSPVTTSCSPPSGATFPIGSTTVTCTATDAQQRTSACTLSVVVDPPPQVLLTRYVAFGDSITAGENGQNALTSDVGGFLRFERSIILYGQDYPTVLRSSLQSRYTLQSAAIVVSNKGVPGESAGESSTLSRFAQAISGYQVVLLMEGSNDLYNAASGGSSITNAALDGLQSMIRMAKSAGVRPYLATVPPMDPNACTPICRGFAAPLVAPFDDRIRSLAASEGAPLVDVYTAFGGDLTLLSADGLHPNAAGYERISDTFFHAIQATLEPHTALSGRSVLPPMGLGGY